MNTEEQVACQICGCKACCDRIPVKDGKILGGNCSACLTKAKAIIPIVEAEVKEKKGVVCPFCGEDDFDFPGLKWHLTGVSILGNNNCEAYQNTEEV